MLGWWINKQSQLNHRKMTEQQQGELNNALIETAENGQVEVCQLLIERGANVNATNRSGITPLHLAAYYGHVEVCRLLIDRRADINTMTSSNWTPLHLAAFHGYVDACQLLIQAGANVNATTYNDGMTPLHWAATKGHVEVCQRLIQAKSNVNATDDWDWTPMHCAARKGHLKVCRLLLELGADVHAITRNNETPLDLAINSDSVEALAYFYVNRVVNFHQPNHTGQMPWDRLTTQEQGTLTKAMEDHHEKIAILQTKGLPIELARLVMGYL